ncbi:hypothetical protein SLEP1_g11480 [Rubroshorea leprosula]|uniref:B-like cyclin n=1 Tax=Rubroshorea leprosula TaxID=152421 RepID=A0AAV5IJZ1_9ROSI|nr:hypothetical protein SLEP1_g11480 [Rubroshorea leprosula]
MSTVGNRRSSLSSSTTSSLAKRQASSSENTGKAAASRAKKRAPLANITNQKNGSRSSVASSALVPCSSNKVTKAKKAQPASFSKTGFSGNVLSASANVKPSSIFPPKITPLLRDDEITTSSIASIPVPRSMDVAEEYRLVPDTLYLTVNYIDRYLSGNVMNRQRLQLLGVACMMIAAKYEEICAPQVEEFCYITDNTYFKEEVLEMESAVLNYLKFEMTAPTAKCFLRRFVRAAAQEINEVPPMQLECLANYITELSLLEYSMLCYAPSLIAASAIFLAKFILLPSRRPWNSTLLHYTLYTPSDLIDCVKDLHGLCCNSLNSTLPAIREKYSQHKYKCVAKKYCPPSIPLEFFHNEIH